MILESFWLQEGCYLLKGVGADIIHRLGVVRTALSVGKLMPQMEANGGGYTIQC